MAFIWDYFKKLTCGFATVSAQNGYRVFLNDTGEGILEKAMKSIEANIDTFIESGFIKKSEKGKTLARLVPTTSLEEAAKGADFVLEAITE